MHMEEWPLAAISPPTNDTFRDTVKQELSVLMRVIWTVTAWMLKAGFV